MFGIYLLINGMERFMIELIRVNKAYLLFGFKLSQAEIIALMLALCGLVLILIAKRKRAV